MVAAGLRVYWFELACYEQGEKCHLYDQSG